MKKTKKIRSAIPIYLFGATWVVYGLIFPLYKMSHIMIALALSLVVLAVAMIAIPSRTVEVETEEKFKKTGDKDTDSLIKEGEGYIKQLKAYNSRVDDALISRRISRMVIAATAIFKEISQSPDKAPRIRRFMSYYMPTSVKILDAREKLASSGVKGENITSTIKSIEENLELIAKAFERQLDNLFEDEALDISTDIDVLESMLASEGITTDKT